MAIEFEHPWQAADSGLVEGATPECRSPRDLVVWQQAQDRLFAEAAFSAGQPDGQFVLIKNNCDSDGRTYGSHENYDAAFASGSRLWLWRAGLITLFPILIVQLLLLFVILLLLLGLFWLAMSIAWLAVKYWAAKTGKQAPRKEDFLGKGLFSDDRHAAPWPLWIEPAVVVAAVVILLPLIVPLFLLIRGVAFHQQRRRLLPFLITRTVFRGQRLA